MELINLDEIEETINNVGDMKSIFDECLVDLDRELQPLDTLVYFGFNDRNKRCSVLTRGEYSCIVASAKTKKSFCKSLVTASYIGGRTNEYTDHIKGNRRTDGYIIDLDTEQGKYYAQNTFKRVERLVGNRYGNYKPLETRSKSIKERLDLIEWIVNESEFSGKIDMILVDGVADLVYNTNDIEEGAKLAESMLKWTSKGIHMCLIIHKAGNNDKARGHLGTAITIKAESIIFMDRILDDNGNLLERNTVKVRCGYVRGLDFEDFYLTVNDDGLPFTHTDEKDNIFKRNIEEKEIPKITPNEAFNFVDF